MFSLNKRNFYIFIIASVAFFIIAVLLLVSRCGIISKNKNYEKVVIINDNIINVEIADNEKLQYKGLSGRENLCAKCGMLFIFKEKKEKTFVMREMNFPLDIIWIDGNKIIKIDKKLMPEGINYKKLYNSVEPVNYVLEVNSGYIDAHNIKIGDMIKLSL